MQNAIPLRPAGSSPPPGPQPSREALEWLSDTISIDWLTVAARLPGRSMQVAVALCCHCATERSHQVLLSNLACRRFGLDRNAKYRGLASLEEAGLVAVERRPGRSPLVTVLANGGGDEWQS